MSNTKQSEGGTCVKYHFQMQQDLKQKKDGQYESIWAQGERIVILYKKKITLPMILHDKCNTTHHVQIHP